MFVFFSPQQCVNTKTFPLYFYYICRSIVNLVHLVGIDVLLLDDFDENAFKLIHDSFCSQCIFQSALLYICVSLEYSTKLPLSLQ